MTVSIHITHLVFLSPRQPAAEIKFGPGLNLVYGPSNTGKSSILDAIDYMLGRSRKLKEIPEHDEYEKILLGIATSNGSCFTLQRSISGGSLSYYDGTHYEPPEDVSPTPLKLSKPTKKVESLPNFLLGLVGLSGKRLKKKSNNETVSLTLRNFVSLFLIDETNIQKESSPYVTTQFTDQTTERSRLRLMLTGVDDSALVADERETQTVSRQAQLNLLSELVSEQEDAISGLSADGVVDKAALEEQLSRLGKTLSIQSDVLASSETEYRAKIKRRNEARASIDASERRLAEIREMRARFQLLREQYDSDDQRLDNLIEAGTLFVAFPSAKCPVCGAETPADHTPEVCDGDAEVVISAAGAEKEKIAALSAELDDVLAQLDTEELELTNDLPEVRKRLSTINAAIGKISPAVAESRNRYSEIVATKSSIEKTLLLFDDLERLQKKREELENQATESQSEKESSSRLPTKSLHKLSEILSRMLADWELPNAKIVHFDKQTDDFVIGGKNRASNGKGHRALTHAAATLALLKYTEENEFAYPGFVILDSPLLAYEKPEFDQENLAESDINLGFFRYLTSWNTRQVIVLENKKSIPSEFEEGTQVTHFTKSHDTGRYGFFPIATTK